MSEFRDKKVTIEFIRAATDAELYELIYECGMSMSMKVSIPLQDLAVFYYKKKTVDELNEEIEVIQPEIILIEGS